MKENEATSSELAEWHAKADRNKLLPLLDSTAAHLPDDPVLVEDWIGRFTEHGLLDSPQLLHRLAAGGAWDASAFGLRLIAQIQEDRRDWKDAVARWSRVIDAAPGIDHEALLVARGAGAIGRHRRGVCGLAGGRARQ